MRLPYWASDEGTRIQPLSDSQGRRTPQMALQRLEERSYSHLEHMQSCGGGHARAREEGKNHDGCVQLVAEGAAGLLLEKRQLRGHDFE
ncbi:Nn.00g069460.m01.CDS01 [Neocucurbitaria sp. VM-36]